MRKLKFGVILLVVVLGIGIYYYKFISEFSYLASIKWNVTSVDSSGSEGGFSVKKGDKIMVTLNSTVKEGNLQITLTDENEQVIRKFSTDKNYTEQVVFDDAGDYELSAKYNDFVGSFNVKCK